MCAQTILVADGKTDSYTLITNVLGAGPEVPDCSDPQFGPHITQATDPELGKFVFQFHGHAKIDNDRCVMFDRQRIELKTDGSSPAGIRATNGDTMNFRWKFKLDRGFQATSKFTHIHQIKAGDGNDGAPLITYSPYAGNQLRIEYTPDKGPSVDLKITELQPFLGTWVEVNETVTFAAHGSIAVTLTRVRDGKVLMTYTNPDINLVRSGSTLYRPKIGLYRSIKDPAAIRDEIVLFDQFCIAKLPLKCDGKPAPRLSPAELKKASMDFKPGPDFSLSLNRGEQTVKVGDTTSFILSVTPRNGFKGRVVFSSSGMPPGTTATFNPRALENGSGSTTVTVNLDKTALDRRVTATFSGCSGELNHAALVTLQVKPASWVPAPARAGQAAE
jgi:hypothetical protein